PVFNIDSEDKPAQWLVLATGAARGRLEYAQTREDDRIGWGWTRLRSADLVIGWVAQAVGFSRTDEDSVAAAAQASALEGVEYTLNRTCIGLVSVECRINGVLRVTRALIVAVMLPLTADARIAQNQSTIPLVERRTKLTTVRDVVQHVARTLRVVEQHRRENR